MNSAASTSTSQTQISNEKEEYDVFLSVFFFLGVLALAISILGMKWIGQSLHAVPIVFAVISLSTALLYRSQDYPNVGAFQGAKGKPVGLLGKKIGLVVAFIFYLAGITWITCQTGGARGSPFGSLILLTASLSIFIAKKPWSRILVGMLTILSWVVSSTVLIVTQSPVVGVTFVSVGKSFVAEFSTVIVVVLISAVAGYRVNRIPEVGSQQETAKT